MGRRSSSREAWCQGLGCWVVGPRRRERGHLDGTQAGHHDAPVRTTVTLEPDVAEKLREFAHRSRMSFKAALNAALRRGLVAQDPPSRRGRFVVEPHDGTFRPGVDLGRLNQLSDQLETEAFASRARASDRR